MTVSTDDYQTLWTIYNTDVFLLTHQNISEFKAIIHKAQVNTDRALTLIGDELADRGNNDYFTLLVLKKLHDATSHVDIMLSNHRIEFIADYTRKNFSGKSRLLPGQRTYSFLVRFRLFYPKMVSLICNNVYQHQLLIVP